MNENINRIEYFNSVSLLSLIPLIVCWKYPLKWSPRQWRSTIKLYNIEQSVPTSASVNSLCEGRFIYQVWNNKGYAWIKWTHSESKPTALLSICLGQHPTWVQIFWDFYRFSKRKKSFEGLPPATALSLLSELVGSGWLNMLHSLLYSQLLL